MKRPQAYTIIYQDDEFIALNKASGIAVGGDRWDGEAPRLDKLLSEDLSKRVYSVHRLDKETSGLVLFAFNSETHRLLSLAFQNGAMHKGYLAVVHGRVLWQEMSCDAPLVPDGDKAHRTIIDKFRGKKSLTRFRFIAAAGNYSVLEALPETGRTHQIRAHLASLGHPIVCDGLYGKPFERGGEQKIYLSHFKKGWRGDPLSETPLLSRLGLHAASLGFGAGVLAGAATGAAGERLFEAPLPRDMAALINQIKKCS